MDTIQSLGWEFWTPAVLGVLTISISVYNAFIKCHSKRESKKIKIIGSNSTVANNIRSSKDELDSLKKLESSFRGSLEKYIELLLSLPGGGWSEVWDSKKEVRDKYDQNIRHMHQEINRIRIELDILERMNQIEGSGIVEADRIVDRSNTVMLEARRLRSVMEAKNYELGERAQEIVDALKHNPS
tara:strand:- start:144 stop:698 length:555 start_codon:yes stop_codon:yes gene_type:complete